MISFITLFLDFFSVNPERSLQGLQIKIVLRYPDNSPKILKVLNYSFPIGLSPWIPSISNMLWYSFSSSIGKSFVYNIVNGNIDPLAGNHKLLKEKILSIPDHISNTHVFPSNTDHKACNHPPLTGDRSKAWLSKDSMVQF